MPSTTTTQPPATTTPPPGSSAPANASFADGMLAAHNAWRATVGVPPMQWSDDLADYAQEWANTLQGQQCGLEHRPTYTYGENLASATGMNLSPDGVVGMWGDEGQFYDYDSNTCARGEICGHYTQVVWRNSTTLGCAQASCGNTTVWVCNYDPPGNMNGARPY